MRPGSRPADLPSATIRPGTIIDGVAYTPAMLRTIILERHQMASELRLVKDTLRLRTEALNRLIDERNQQPKGSAA